MFIDSLKHPLKFRMFLLSKLPSAFFAGLRIKDVSENSCSVSVPYKWFTKNPFHSTYFACLAMAAEMSTGTLCVIHLHKKKLPVSMLVTRLESEFHKKATGVTNFICEDGMLIKEAIDKAMENEEAYIVRAKSVGMDKGGIVIAEFYITWSFKAKRTKLKNSL